MDYPRPYGRNLSFCPILAVALVGSFARICRDHWLAAMAFPSILGFCASVDRKQKILFGEIRTSRVNTGCVSFWKILPGCLSEHAPQQRKFVRFDGQFRLVLFAIVAGLSAVCSQPDFPITFIVRHLPSPDVITNFGLSSTGQMRSV